MILGIVLICLGSILLLFGLWLRSLTKRIKHMCPQPTQSNTVPYQSGTEIAQACFYISLFG